MHFDLLRDFPGDLKTMATSLLSLGSCIARHHTPFHFSSNVEVNVVSAHTEEDPQRFRLIELVTCGSTPALEKSKVAN